MGSNDYTINNDNIKKSASNSKHPGPPKSSNTKNRRGPSSFQNCDHCLSMMPNPPDIGIKTYKSSKIQMEDAGSKPQVAVEDHDRYEESGSCCVTFLKSNALILCTVVGIVVGFCVGLGLQEVSPSEDVLVYVGFPGELFLRALKATIVPIVVCMVITATSSVDAKQNGRMAGVAVASFYFTAVLAVLNALLLFYALKPEAGSLSEAGDNNFSTKLKTEDVFLDLVRNLLPDNIVGATISQTTTVYEPKESTVINSTTNATETVVKYSKTLGQAGGVNILGLILICAAVGVSSKKVLPSHSTFLEFFRQGQEVTLMIMRWMAWMTPFGVASLVAKSIASVSSLSTLFDTVWRLTACVTSGLAIHQLIILPLVYFLLARRNPFVFLARCTRAFFVSFAATATSVAIPHMIEASEKNRVSKRVYSFVIPMSVTLHADGSGLFIASASFFIAQTSGAVSMDAGNIFIILCLSSVLSLAIPPVPSASIVNIAIILTSLNCPLNAIALLFAVEWLLDRLRSGVNATSHVFCAAFTEAICGGQNEIESQFEEMPTSEGMSNNDAEQTVVEMVHLASL